MQRVKVSAWIIGEKRMAAKGTLEVSAPVERQFLEDAVTVALKEVEKSINKARKKQSNG